MGARRALVGTVVTLVVVGAGAVVADRVALGLAEDRAREVVTQQLAVTGEPDVTIHGFPFLTQLAARELDDVDAAAAGLTLEGIDATDVRVTAQGVGLTEPATVRAATLAATLPPASLERVLVEQTDLDVTLTVEGGLLRVAGDVLGLSLSAGLEPRVEDGVLLVDLADVALGDRRLDLDDLPGGLGDDVSGIEVPVEGLPEGVVLTSAVVVPDGVRITAEGTDVVLPVAP
ncbi:DUF2993 domain-containing protein [Cellulomonas shaoxiangyii]|uniref:DUF2993 domain-containing protein n=1 Tax=Cellulomonas shaoxiangyii TaxID=2566013 RepID=A0A4P7SIA8_9CELL|nr:DUF2993 domain-containing protein [Cellulomonas shaoxiangyii]QCB92384.1 DUF2993 domain-containing protein [Cellulomonas shaoxiangyii]TGY86222.1 DUF2993 domain-containing protein [Cellulomonas shaoxiangyii]